MKDREIFGAFEHADEETIAKLSEIPVLSDEDKERIFRESIRKADMAGASEDGANIIMMETSNKENSGTPAAVTAMKRRNRAVMNVAAACVILAVGASMVINGFGSFDGLIKTSDDSGNTASDTVSSAEAADISGADSNNSSKSDTSGYYHPYNGSSMARRYNVSGMSPHSEEYISYEITDEEQLERIDEVLDEIEKIKDECVAGENSGSEETGGFILSTSDDIKYFISMVGDQPQLTINFIDYNIPQELIDQLMAAIAPTATGQYAEAMRLRDALSTIDGLAGGKDAVYEEASDPNVGEGYAKLTGFGFSSVSEIDSFMRDNMTDDFINALYGSVVGTERPMYTEYEGALYIDTFAKRDSGFMWTETEMVINDVTAASFSATAEYSTADGGTAQLKLYIVNDNGVWKISGIEFL